MSMKTNLNALFQQRFQGHEAPVDLGVWEGIQQQLAQAAPAAGEDGVSKLFKERFQAHGTAVDPSAWANISSQLGHTAAVSTSASIGWIGWVAAGTVAVVVGAIAWNSLLTTGPVAQASMDAPAIVGSAPAQEPEPLPVVATAASPSAKANTLDPALHPSPKRAAPQTQGGGEVASTAWPNAPNTALEVATLPPLTPPLQEEGAARVESIIAELTSEVKTEVLSHRDPILPEPPGAISDPEEDDAALSEKAEPLPELFIPNTFTPNNDGANDTYTIKAEGFASILIRVYALTNNRLVFSTNSAEPWTGAGCEDGMYMVAVEGRLEDGRTVTEGKVVWLNREQMR